MTDHERKSIERLLKDHVGSFNAYVAEDTKWKERAEPMVKAYENANGFMATVKAFSKPIIFIGGIAAAVMGIIKLFK
jgi:hypothetical protein